MTTRREFVYSGLVVVALLLALTIATRPRWWPHVRSSFGPEAIVASQQDHTPAPKAPADPVGAERAEPTPEQQRASAWVKKGSSALEYGTQPIDAPLAERWTELERASRENDPAAGLQLHFAVEECAYLKSKEARELLYAPQNASDGLSAQALASLNAKLDRLERARKNCAGITDEQLAMSKEILRRSAEAGNPYAALLYQDRGRPSEEEAMRDPSAWSRYKDDTHRYLQGLASRCVVEGIQRLASMYQSRSHPAPTSATAYAYYEWERLAWIARGVNADDPSREARMSEGLSESQRRAAQQRAQALFNRYCL